MGVTARVSTTTVAKLPKLEPELTVPVKLTLPVVELGELVLLIRKPVDDPALREVVRP